jgi:hypothetical protein
MPSSPSSTHTMLKVAASSISAKTWLVTAKPPHVKRSWLNVPLTWSPSAYLYHIRERRRRGVSGKVRFFKNGKAATIHVGAKTRVSYWMEKSAPLAT